MKTVIVKQIRLSSKAKDSLIKLKSKTGIQNWNILCRWAFCYSLAENSVPIDLPVQDYSNVEMSWLTFGGEYAEIYELLIREWCHSNDIPLIPENLAKYFRLHLERGIAHLSGTGLINNLDDLLLKAVRS